MVISLFCFFIVLVLIACLDYIGIERQFKELLQFSISFILIFFITFRFGVPDYFSYIKIFNASSSLESLDDTNEIHGEIGYLFLNKIIKLLGGNEFILFFIVGFISVFLTIKFYRGYTKYIFIAILLYFSHVFILREMIQIRSGMAIAIVMFSIPYVYKRLFVPFLIIVLIASLFHTLSSLFVLIYFLYPYFKSTEKQVLFLTLLGVFFGLFFTLERLEEISIAIGAPPIILGYLSDEQYNYSLGLLNPVLIKHFLVIFFILKNKKYIEKEVPYFEVLLLCYVIGALWLAAFNNFAIFSARIATMFSNVEHVLIPSLLYVRKYKLIVFLLIISYSIFSFISKWEIIKHWSFVFSY